MDRGACERGLEIRREVLGDSYVAQAQSRVDEFTRPFQDLLNGYCWGEIWGRPGLPRKIRSLLNLAMLTALNRGPEVKLHVRGAINNGVTVDEIKEVLLHATIYCGIPAGLDSFKAANDVLKEMGVV